LYTVFLTSLMDLLIFAFGFLYSIMLSVLNSLLSLFQFFYFVFFFEVNGAGLGKGGVLGNG